MKRDIFEIDIIPYRIALIHNLNLFIIDTKKQEFLRMDDIVRL